MLTLDEPAILAKAAEYAAQIRTLAPSGSLPGKTPALTQPFKPGYDFNL